MIIIYNGDKYFSERPFQNTKEDEDWYLEGGYNYPQVENRDYYTSNTIEPSIILTGNKMISFLRHFKLWPRKTYKNLSLKDKQEIIFRYKFKFDNNRVNLMSEIKSMSEEELDHILYIEGIL